MPTTATTYTTIPISGTDVIFRSFQNLSSFLSLLRPWPEFISNAASFDLPDSLHHAATRIRLNSKYFSVNYGIIITACFVVSLIGDPKSLLIFGSVLTLWLVLYFFREDPMVVWGHHVHDHLVTAGLVFVTGIAVWWLGFVSSLLIGVAVGVLVSVVHGVFRNPRGIYLDEIDAESEGLISPTSVNSRVYDFSS
ncbi:putative prenylated rab acceptor P [Helianthus annuus]|uniref:PRA1 family protein n=1 Tax=Helianthus annuus TaxID=4232 RepID=A0A251TDS9_HELAN|nr:PRA1 family protein G2 [Helianthus annuus]KAF5803388.1 putative prenylated rab acceptor PRA1 [Helianthus annuus]KAJ0567970.1 putative prenylated rab acceptor P [Helianthus annuus]KAJ0574403.1 putative prenylated rab acceptor P [Helianthus annuus]KAJ0738739.1 putative prenylated rab acceptor P [Helianthus annuus]KAJ0781108.1 putative prenylated rab acceptor P [Helianthus annuus]